MTADAVTPPEGRNVNLSTFRIVARHPDKAHKDHAWAAVGPVFDDRAEALEALDAVDDEHREEADRRDESIPADERVRITLSHRLAEFEVLGFQFKVQQLRETAWAEDDAGGIVATAHDWKDV